MSQMITRTYVLQFTTPAFLGNAEQSGQWRTPPFKHLLREWWRVAWAEANDFNVNLDEMRLTEGRLFGVAADEGDTRQSQVRIRLGRWDMGKEKNWGKGLKVFHPEVGKKGMPVGSDLYLGYGPLAYDKNTKGTRLKANAAIQAGEENDLKLAYPDAEKSLLDRALALASAFGALGGRARNGWGSLALQGDTLPGLESLPLRDWRDCMNSGWAHAIGQDEKGALIWATKTFQDWQEVMQTLARLKIELRTSFSFQSGNNAPRPESRHWLSYPVTNHSVRAWGRDSRLPNTLRFKVRHAANGKLYGVIFHMPCKPPVQFSPDDDALAQVWRKAHQFLDEHDAVQRSPK